VGKASQLRRPRAFARVIVASWHINRLQRGRDVDRATPSDAHTQNDESGRVKACQNAGAKLCYRGQGGNFLLGLSLTAFEPKRSFGGFHSTCLSALVQTARWKGWYHPSIA